VAIIKLERDGQRIYLTGDTYPLRQHIKAIGGHWDAGRRAWWVGLAKLTEAEKLAAEAAPASLGAPGTGDGDAGSGTPAGGAAAAKAAAVADLDRAVVRAKVEYKGRNYYQIAETRDRESLRLVSLDGKVDFWALRTNVVFLKTYDDSGSVRRGSGRYQRDPMTLGSLRRVIERQRDPATRTGTCTECGNRGPHGQTCRECHEGTFA